MISAKANVALLWNTAASARRVDRRASASRTRWTVSVLVAAAALTVSRGAQVDLAQHEQVGNHSDGVLHHGLRMEHL